MFQYWLNFAELRGMILQVGPVINKSDLDTEKMTPFQEAGMDKLMVYMPVPIEGKQR